MFFSFSFSNSRNILYIVFLNTIYTTSRRAYFFLFKNFFKKIGIPRNFLRKIPIFIEFYFLFF